MNPSPEFLLAIDRHEAMVATLGLEHPLTRQVMALVMELAPDELKTIMRDKAREMGLIPARPDGYTDDGTPCYNVESIAASTGQTVEEVHEAMREMLADRAALGLPDLAAIDPSTVHRVQ